MMSLSLPIDLISKRSGPVRDDVRFRRAGKGR